LRAKKGEQVPGGRDDLGAGHRPAAATISAKGKHAKKGTKRKTPALADSKHLSVEVGDADSLGAFGHRGALDGATELQPGPARQLREALFGEHPFDGAHGDLHAFLHQQLGDLTGREAALSVLRDRSAHLGTDTTAGCLAFRYRFAEVDFAVAELVAQKSDVRRGVAEAVSEDCGR